VDEDERLSGAVLLVIQRHAVGADLGHATSMRAPSGGPQGDRSETVIGNVIVNERMTPDGS
jgi:hypothetical protein